MKNKKTSIAIRQVADIVTARQRGRDLAVRLGFTETEATLIATIISEIARNIVNYAGEGEIMLQPARDGDHEGMIITGRDDGPGIADLQRALVGGYSTSGGLGLGICGIRRMVNELDIDTGPQKGTKIVAKKWLD